MPYVMSSDYSPVGDLGAAPCPPPEGCPPGTQVNPRYPASSSTCCKPVRGATGQPPTGTAGTPAGTGAGTTAGTGAGRLNIRITPGSRVATPIGPRPPKPPGTGGAAQPSGEDLLPTPGPEAPASGAATLPWYDEYRWWLVGGSAFLVLGTLVVILATRKKA